MKALFDLTGKNAIITGAGSGIGRSIATLFARQGAHVNILDLNQEHGNEVVHEISKEGGVAEFYPTDISDHSQVSEVISTIYRKSGNIDILVNNAGISKIGNIEETSVEDMDRLYRVNIRGAFSCSQAVIKVMKTNEKGGVILNIASIAAILGVKDRFAYSMSKGALLNMTFTLAKDYLDYNIRSNAISPGRVHTPFVDEYLKKNYPGKEDEMMETLSKTQPIGRMGRPDEIAHLALYLCSDEASFITGSNYTIDGGFVTLNS